MVDQTGAIAMFVDDAWTFNSTDATFLVLHKTAGFSTAQECAAYFQAGSDGRHVSAHYIIGQDGAIVQCVLESRGAGANCCVEAGHAAFIPDAWDGTSDNGNVHSISIEHIDPATDNSTPLTAAQARASFQLIHDICVRHNIPMRRATTDGQGGIIGHMDIAPQSRARCPGNYPWDALWQFLGGPTTMAVPQGWHDDGTTLTAPNNIPVKLGFRDYILTHQWNPANVPQVAEYHVNQVQLHNTTLGPGQIQPTRDGVFWYTTTHGVVYEPFLGLEIDAAYEQIKVLQGQIATLQDQIKALQAQLDTSAQAAQIAALQKKLGAIAQILSS